VDTFAMSFDSIPAVEKVSGAKFMVQKGVAATSLYLMGAYYVGAGTPNQSPSYEPDKRPWIAGDPNPGSAGWERAKKVRLAMSLAIDRQLIIDKVLGGHASQTAMMWWAPFGKSTSTRGFKWDSNWKWEYNPQRAKQLLTEASYPNGFELTVTPAIRGAPGEVEACEAILPMWETVGIRATFRKVPYSTVNAEYRERKVPGITCHASHPFVNPLMGYTQAWRTRQVGSTGVEHPYIDERIDKANGIFDEDKRNEVLYEIGRFVFDNTLDVALYYVDFVYPLGPRIDDWSKHLRYADARLMSAIEYIPHRK
jgi:ABC-type transport system substrate-binding protein